MNMAASPKILALDFDGVICDGLIEYFEVAWRTYCQVWLPECKTPPDDLAPRFYCVRPVIETGWEMPVLIKALVDGVPEEKFFQEWGTIAQQILQTDNLKAIDIGQKLDQLRDEWIANDLESWLSLHRFYAGVVEKINRILDSEIQLYIITTKEGRFVQQLLAQQGVHLAQEVIFGKDFKLPKYEILRGLIQKTHTEPALVWFVEDRLKALQLVQQQSDLTEVKLFLADWGYNTPTDRAIAHEDAGVHLISLSHFVQDFPHWLQEAR